jgi:hypothetical protein
MSYTCLPPSYRHRKNRRARVAREKMSLGLFSLFLGTSPRFRRFLAALEISYQNTARVILGAPSLRTPLFLLSPSLRSAPFLDLAPYSLLEHPRREYSLSRLSLHSTLVLSLPRHPSDNALLYSRPRPLPRSRDPSSSQLAPREATRLDGRLGRRCARNDLEFDSRHDRRSTLRR